MQFDCQACGACCHLFDVLLTPGEADRFERRPHLHALTVLHRLSSGMELRFMRREAPAADGTQRCSALNGGLGDCSCGIYADRPQLCADFEPGSEDCLAARRKVGLPVTDAPVAVQ